MIRFLVAVLSFAICSSAYAGREPAFKTYDRALNLIHGFAGSGPELDQAMQMAEGLWKSAPKSGYAQVLIAEALSTFELSQNGDPPEVRDQVLKLADEALTLNPKLAQAHVAKARAQLRSSMFEAANASIEKALKADPNLSGAIFMRADYYRRTNAIAQADIWYRKFIASAPTQQRKANGYYWLGFTYHMAAHNDMAKRAEYTAKAKEAYETSLKLDQPGAWNYVNYAMFLNDYAEDFDGAEKYARKALAMMDFPMARYHLAAAQYQKLATDWSPLPKGELTAAAGKVSTNTGISLEAAIAFDCFSSAMLARLTNLQLRIAREGPAGPGVAAVLPPKRVSCG